MSFDHTKNIEELECDAWEIPEDGYPSRLVERCCTLRTIPVGELQPEDLRTLIGQNIGLIFLIPLALKLLERQPLMDAEFYPGDLLGYTLSRDDSFWQQHPEWKDKAQRIFAHAERLSRPGSIDLDAENVLKTLRAYWRAE